MKTPPEWQGLSCPLCTDVGGELLKTGSDQGEMLCYSAPGMAPGPTPCTGIWPVGFLIIFVPLEDAGGVGETWTWSQGPS